ncbi:3-dehydroquinate synthase [Roseibium hamelinense]|uniref:3-dehydroquinate synthase n=1 Tax=Roseibium hamelinense TaxID=150831 RepID=A0A562TGF2_9HYPH|nr:sedoheptulose 7-phosphate cyclase [Roseibium hamelinense]MTI46155.1 sedoheptulose 7-phosphate cyclase [Roseibium hamelinense]TWI92652.1 3-dehydroquinate synthase [Roseibium hamelinense]
MTIAENWTVKSQQDVAYSVEIVKDVLDVSNLALVDGESGARRLIVTDNRVNDLYGDRIRAYAQTNMAEHRLLVLPDGELNKNWQAVETVLEAIDNFKLDRRREPVIAIGGGVLTDVVGFACSIYRRNTPFVRVPTTLMGIVDAGVGIKTGANFKTGKNKIGTYFPAVGNLLDMSFLGTLDKRHISNGLAEILKIALIKDERLFSLLEEHGETVLASHFQEGTDYEIEIIARSIAGMLEELEPNLWEHKLERLVDYGHTFSPNIEMKALPELLHGEAVNVDMALTTAIGLHRGLVNRDQAETIFGVMHQMGLPVSHPVADQRLLLQALADTTRHRDGKQRLPLPVGIGNAVFVNDLTEADISAGLKLVAVLGAKAASAIAPQVAGSEAAPVASEEPV